MHIIIANHMQVKSQQLNDEIFNLKKLLKKLPEGELLCTRNGKYYKWYISDGHSHTYIPKKQRALAESLALKKYYRARLKDCEREKRAADYYLKYQTGDQLGNPFGRKSNVEKLLESNTEYFNLLNPHIQPLKIELLNWAQEPYHKNLEHPENLIHKTASGNKVRSKSEALIETFLRIHKIPFRYECALYIGDTLVFPDFTIRHPDTGEIMYWEHFGLMEFPSYRKNTLNKLMSYCEEGIIPGIHLITTYETSGEPLTSEMVEKTIQYYFG